MSFVPKTENLASATKLGSLRSSGSLNGDPDRSIPTLIAPKMFSAARDFGIRFGNWDVTSNSITFAGAARANL